MFLIPQRIYKRLLSFLQEDNEDREELELVNASKDDGNYIENAIQFNKQQQEQKRQLERSQFPADVSSVMGGTSTTAPHHFSPSSRLIGGTLPAVPEGETASSAALPELHTTASPSEQQTPSIPTTESVLPPPPPPPVFSTTAAPTTAENVGVFSTPPVPTVPAVLPVPAAPAFTSTPFVQVGPALEVPTVSPIETATSQSQTVSLISPRTPASAAEGGKKKSQKRPKPLRPSPLTFSPSPTSSPVEKKKKTPPEVKKSILKTRLRVQAGVTSPPKTYSLPKRTRRTIAKGPPIIAGPGIDHPLPLPARPAVPLPIVVPTPTVPLPFPTTSAVPQPKRTKPSQDPPKKSPIKTRLRVQTRVTSPPKVYALPQNIRRGKAKEKKRKLTVFQSLVEPNSRGKYTCVFQNCDAREINDLPAYKKHLVNKHSSDMTDMERKSVALIAGQTRSDRNRPERTIRTEPTPTLTVNPKKRKRPKYVSGKYPGNFERYMRGMGSPKRKSPRMEQKDAERDTATENT